MTQEELQKMLDEIPNKKFAKFSDKELERFENMKGKIFNENTRKKISTSNKGKTRSDKTKQKLSVFRSGYKHNQETKSKMSKSHKGKKLSDETRKKLKEIRQKEIECFKYPDMIYVCDFKDSYDAADKLNLLQSCINLTCNHKRKSTGGYTFRYKD